MAKIGTNMKLEVARSRRQELRRFYEGILGCERVSPSEDFDAYLFADGFSLGAYFVEDDVALTDDQWKRGPWIEILVDDVDRTTAELAELGVTPFDYQDRAHSYFQGPGGLVFRLAGEPQ